MPTAPLLQVPADVPPAVADRIKELAIETFRVLGCEGMARIDFFLHGEQAFVNEANTLPGFTNISMYSAAVGGQRPAAIRTDGCADRPRPGASQRRSRGAGLRARLKKKSMIRKSATVCPEERAP